MSHHNPNPHRGGEHATLEMQDWEDAEKHTWKNSSSALSKEERHMADNLKVLYIRGKRGQNVPVLFTPETTVAVHHLQKISNESSHSF